MSESMNHEQAYELLPWYLNGTLEDAERARVESHVRTCLTCHRELKEERGLSELIASSATVELSAEAGFDRLSTSLDASRETPRSTERSELERWVGWPSFATAGLVTATIGILVLVGIAWLVLPVTSQSPGFVTLTGDTRASNHLDVIFASEITEPDMRALLSEFDATIIAGPTEIGRYTIRLNDAAINDERVVNIVQAMNGDDRIQFAGPSLIQEREE